jgi:TetR/AcrR family transcriptional regulator, lmrAB and yxaGH operons repressor
MARSDTKARMVEAAKESFRLRGVTATGFSEILERSGAARGAIYHHFPSGKAELTQAVIASTAADVSGLIRALFEQAESPLEAVDAMLDLCIAAADERDGDLGCPITPAVLEADGDAATLAAGHRAFALWEAEVAAGLEGAGHDVSRAGALATLIVSAIEGALVLSRAERSSMPLRRTKRALSSLLA